ncbi:DUF4407 domain-containing protein [Micromonospora sp. AMSO1212t]|uniref:DUF4407 domain-containing protein n=1 Tax=Micromonospora sp. AMSO1212t TaxID=2650565 RepID=UPI00124AF7AF|nr:DUF4407 domain-containing protein [Micromonospora sp. AMSO1212t]KAB1906940.1 DUF4407 domain-containing protein [Micromonospora sp. AMSO1212t]
MQRSSTFLARLGGADPGVLARAKQISRGGVAKDQARFVALGLVLLATAGLAVVSMAFAMTDGLRVGVAGAVLIGIFWGVIILVVDRALILSLKPTGSKWLLFWMVLPRILMAALLGLVISTPLTLRIFADEIEQQMTLDNIRKAEGASIVLAEGNRQKELADLKGEITKYERYLAGEVAVSSPVLAAAEAEHKQATTDYQTKQASAEKAWAAWRCELDGELCEAGSGKRGDGPRASALRREYDRKEKDATAARKLVQTKLAALEKARAELRQDSSRTVSEAQDEAKRVLPGLRQQRDILQAAIQSDLDTSNKEAADNTGLLARLAALAHLGDENGWAKLAHLLVAALFFMIELLPVAIKSLSILGPPSAYDQIDELDTKEVVKAAGRQEYIDKDLEKRKKRIAEAVHDEVEAVMLELATDQVEAWKQKVRQMSVQPPRSTGKGSGLLWPGNGQPAQATGSGAPSARATVTGRRSAAARVAAALNLPPSAKRPS